MPEKMFIAVDSWKLKFGSSNDTLKVSSSTNVTLMSVPVIGDRSTAGKVGISSLLSIRSSRANRTSSSVWGYPSCHRAPVRIWKVNSVPCALDKKVLKMLGIRSSPSGDIARPYWNPVSVSVTAACCVVSDGSAVDADLVAWRQDEDVVPVGNSLRQRENLALNGQRGGHWRLAIGLWRKSVSQRIEPRSIQAGAYLLRRVPQPFNRGGRVRTLPQGRLDDCPRCGTSRRLRLLRGASGRCRDRSHPLLRLNCRLRLVNSSRGRSRSGRPGLSSRRGLIGRLIETCGDGGDSQDGDNRPKQSRFHGYTLESSANAGAVKRPERARWISSATFYHHHYSPQRDGVRHRACISLVGGANLEC